MKITKTLLVAPLIAGALIASSFAIDKNLQHRQLRNNESAKKQMLTEPVPNGKSMYIRLRNNTPHHDEIEISLAPEDNGNYFANPAYDKKSITSFLDLSDFYNSHRAFSYPQWTTFTIKTINDIETEAAWGYFMIKDNTDPAVSPAYIFLYNPSMAESRFFRLEYDLCDSLSEPDNDCIWYDRVHATTISYVVNKKEADDGKKYLELEHV